MTKKEFEEVEALGNRIGYGNMMAIASALWRRTLQKKYGHTLGAFIPTCKEFILKKHHKMTDESSRITDSWLKKYYD